jgi:gentisate 1,2-dioxygenase
MKAMVGTPAATRESGEKTWGNKLDDRLREMEHNRVNAKHVIRNEDLVWEDDYFVRSALVVSSLAGRGLNSLHSFVGEILPGQKTGKHRHTSEAIMLGMVGKGYSVIEGKRYDWNAGDFLVLPPMVWHQHFNASETDTFRYYATSNYPLTEQLGIAYIEVEEAGSHSDAGR